MRELMSHPCSRSRVTRLLVVVSVAAGLLSAVTMQAKSARVAEWFIRSDGRVLVPGIQWRRFQLRVGLLHKRPDRQRISPRRSASGECWGDDRLHNHDDSLRLWLASAGRGSQWDLGLWL